MATDIYWEKIEFDYSSSKKIQYDATCAPFDGKPVLLKLAEGAVEGYWCEPEGHGEDTTGFDWCCLDGKFVADWDAPRGWAPLPLDR